eukprot:TRINITY_DN9431_c0_g4_i1.p1 TRINITY_DN9431_c0_g4~~TRINITY_DN9431_c0_g4_i1.p1  ORF type:complete len:710 (-),score=189.32 TRINITY_DN9431_c0_g4_i1:89-2218(-)
MAQGSQKAKEVTQKSILDAQMMFFREVEEQVKHIIQKCGKDAAKHSVDLLKKQLQKDVMGELKTALRAEINASMSSVALEMAQAQAVVAASTSTEAAAAVVVSATPAAGAVDPSDDSTGLPDFRTRPKSTPNASQRKSKARKERQTKTIRNPMDPKSLGLDKIELPEEETAVAFAEPLLVPREMSGALHVAFDEATDSELQKTVRSDHGLLSKHPNGYDALPSAEKDLQGGDARNLHISTVSMDANHEEHDDEDIFHDWDAEPGPRRVIGKLLRSDMFPWCMGICIFVSAAIIGIRTDHMSRHVGQPPPQMLWLFDLLTLGAFAVEIGLRLFYYRWEFFNCRSDDILWNIFDLSLVISQGLEEVLSCLALIPSIRPLRQLMCLRLVRLLRFLRLLRLLRSMQFFMELRIMCKLALETTKSLTWAGGLVGMFLFLAGVLLTDQITSTRAQFMEDNNTKDLEGISEHFGTLDRTILTLFQAISGGLIWGQPIERLSEVMSPAITPLFCFYIAFWMFAMSNVISSICVHQALAISQEAHEDAIVEQVNSLFMRRSLRRAFSYEEFKDMMDTHPEMPTLFKALNIDAGESQLLFKLLDDDNDGLVDYDEFINGATRLRGNARSLEFAMFVKETRASNAWIAGKVRHLGSCVNWLCTKMHETEKRAGIEASEAPVLREDTMTDLPEDLQKEVLQAVEREYSKDSASPRGGSKGA